MINQRIAIATIETEIGNMTIYFNGNNQPMTGEANGSIEKLDYIPKDLDDAGDYVYQSYQYPDWGLEMFELYDVPEA